METPRDEQSICGECWDWVNEPKLVLLTPEQQQKLGEMLK